MAITRGGNHAAAVPIGGQIVVGPSISAAGQSYMNAINLPANRFDKAIANSHFNVPSRKFTASPDGVPLYTQSHAVSEISLTYRVNKFFFEAAGNYSEWNPTAEIGASRSNVDTYIDINRNLATGGPNPNYLQPYFDGERIQTRLRAKNYTIY